MKDWFSPLFFLFARSSEDQLRRQILLLKAELEMTRKRVEKQRILSTTRTRKRSIHNSQQWVHRMDFDGSVRCRGWTNISKLRLSRTR